MDPKQEGQAQFLQEFGHVIALYLKERPGLSLRIEVTATQSSTGLLPGRAWSFTRVCQARTEIVRDGEYPFCSRVDWLPVKG